VLAFSVGWIEIAADVIAASVVALGFAGYLHALTGVPMVLGALSLIFVLSLVNFSGIGESTRLNMIFAFIEMAGLILVILFAIPHLGSVDYMEMPNGFAGVLGASALIFFAFIGFEDMANITEETKEPKKTAPKALIFSVVITTAIYILVALSAVSLAPWDYEQRRIAAQAAFASPPKAAYALGICLPSHADSYVFRVFGERTNGSEYNGLCNFRSLLLRQRFCDRPTLYYARC